MKDLAFSASSQLRDIIERNIDEIIAAGYRNFEKFQQLLLGNDSSFGAFLDASKSLHGRKNAGSME